MNANTKSQKGSPSRDIFKWAHKQYTSKLFFATDLDLVLVSKNPYRIIAALDFKRGGDKVTFAEAVLYRKWLAGNNRIFIVISDNPKSGPFIIKELSQVDPKPEPPECFYSQKFTLDDWREFNDWEDGLRDGLC